MITVPCRNWKKARAVNSSSSNFPTWVSAEIDPSFTDPGTAGGRVLERLTGMTGAGSVPWGMHLLPYGLGNDNDVFDIKVIGYRRILPAMSDGRFLFIRQQLVHITATISGAVGLAASGGVNPPVLSTERFADTIAIVKEWSFTAATTREGVPPVYSPANDSPAGIVVPLLGCEGYELEWDQTTGTPTMNALIAFLDDWMK